ncbi:vWA domain-containing protein [Candidatus Epulonipiscium viviparus]|uniref:vWA domain-containing protein n=1 Tax=Candidatus Epulonipiscium viviparus TaxID=420336 RepID=UPI00016C09D7|nr:VWA domain-containing protein [Candidatus Epulopiscium viviparus]
MPAINEIDEMPRKELHVFYVLDTSGSMTGVPIAALNTAMEECTVALKDLAKKNADAKLKIAVLEFSTGAKWVTYNGPESLDDEFEWEHLSAGGVTDIGAALRELDIKLSRNGFLKSMTGALMPVIIFMTDGYPTDEYAAALAELRKNRWYTSSTKIGFAIGDDADAAIISSIVGNSEAVIKTSDLELFKRLMKFVTVRASMLASSSRTTSSFVNGSAIVQDAIDDNSLPANIIANLGNNSKSSQDDDANWDNNNNWDDDDNW